MAGQVCGSEGCGRADRCHAGLLEPAGDWTRRSLLARYDSLYNFERRARRTMQQACRAVGWRRCPKDT